MGTIEFRGSGSMVLHRLDREEILREMKWIVANVGHYECSEVAVVNRFGKKASIVKVKEEPNGVFLYPLDKTDDAMAGMLKLAPLFGSDMEELDFNRLYGKLKDCTVKDVWLQFPDADPHTVVGKLLAVKVGEKLVMSVTPVPKDIEEVNREVHRRVAETCERARNGTECGDCPLLAGCEHLEKVDKEMTNEKENLHG